MTFFEKFLYVTNQKNSLLCVGIDPDPEKLPNFFKGDPHGLFKFCQEIISHTESYTAAFKFNFAFFEIYGSNGFSTLEKLMESMPENVLTIADAKRGDIGNTSQMYARAILQNLNFDAVTVNPYLGSDSVLPFLQWPEKGAFVLCLTSNPGAKDFQFFSSRSSPLFLRILQKVQNWNKHKNCGLVVGGTYAEELKKIRDMAPELPFLIPGIGTQGGDLQMAVLNGTDKNGQLALFNVSRGIIFKSRDKNFAKKAEEEARNLQYNINQIRASKLKDDQRTNS